MIYKKKTLFQTTMINWDLQRIFDEALEDRTSSIITQTKSQSVIKKGIKIQKFKDRIEIINVAKGGDYGSECTIEEYDYFYDDGWELGICQVAMNNYLYKLNIIKENIQTEVNTRKNDKHIQNLKNSRDKIMGKYTKTKQKFNQLKSNQINERTENNFSNT